jgi:hypothetical protein
VDARGEGRGRESGLIGRTLAASANGDSRALNLRLVQIVEHGQGGNNMTTTLSRMLTPFVAAFLFAAFFTSPAKAELIGTDQVATPQQSERERVKALVARPEVAKKLQDLGVLPQDAAARVDALTDAEVATLASRIDALPAGGAMSTQEWLLVIIAILVLIIAL